MRLTILLVAATFLITKIYLIRGVDRYRFVLICPDSVCKQEPRDIFLVVDGSASVQRKSFIKVRKFILTLIKAVDVREEMTHFGLLQFSTRKKTKIEFTLDESHDPKVLSEKVKNLKYQSGTATRTGLALGIVEKKVTPHV